MRYILALIIAVPLLTLSPWAFSGEVSSDTPTMERPNMVVGDTWISMDYEWLKASSYTKHISKVILVNEDGSYEAMTEVPEHNRMYHFKYDHKHRFLGGEEKNSGTSIPIDIPIEYAANYPLQVGKKWKFLNHRNKNLMSGIYYLYNEYFEVVSYENISTEAGDFWAFKVHWVTENLGRHGEGYYRGEGDFWISREAKGQIKYKTGWGNKGVLLKFIPGRVEASSTTKLDGNNNNDPAENDNSFKIKSKTETESSNDDPLEAKLEKLKKLLEKGLITEEEAAAKRAKLLEDL